MNKKWKHDTTCDTGFAENGIREEQETASDLFRSATSGTLTYFKATNTRRTYRDGISPRHRTRHQRPVNIDQQIRRWGRHPRVLSGVPGTRIYRGCRPGLGKCVFRIAHLRGFTFPQRFLWQRSKSITNRLPAIVVLYAGR
ncbi:hypothetical protein J6590_021391 [Homalodisca vitripennis]|nr:hypothetical protein J6590_021391 [Homalodisca vitripennis]